MGVLWNVLWCQQQHIGTTDKEEFDRALSAKPLLSTQGVRKPMAWSKSTNQSLLLDQCLQMLVTQ
jgi:hypothetical protein